MGLRWKIGIREKKQLQWHGTALDNLEQGFLKNDGFWPVKLMMSYSGTEDTVIAQPIFSYTRLRQIILACLFVHNQDGTST
jgi:hypothetical protein